MTRLTKHSNFKQETGKDNQVRSIRKLSTRFQNIPHHQSFNKSAYITSCVEFVNQIWHPISMYVRLYVGTYLLISHLYHFFNLSISLKPIIYTTINSYNSYDLLFSHMFLITNGINHTNSWWCIPSFDPFWFFFHSNFWPECN